MTYRCDGCNARRVVFPSHAEQARCDGSLGTTVDPHGQEIEFLIGPTAHKATLPGPMPIERSDRVLVKLPDGWDRRFGPKGTQLLHRCAKCLAQGVNFHGE